MDAKKLKINKMDAKKLINFFNLEKYDASEKNRYQKNNYTNS